MSERINWHKIRTYYQEGHLKEVIEGVVLKRLSEVIEVGAGQRLQLARIVLVNHPDRPEVEEYIEAGHN